MVIERGSVNRSISSKKAQVTVFIIIGIIILFVTAGILFITRSSVEERITDEGAPIISVVPTEFQPIQIFTENCLSQLGKNGLILIGGQGGYINPGVLGDYSVNDPTNSKGINLQPTKIPYWRHNVEDNLASNIVFESLKPEISKEDDPGLSIEVQLERYVEEKLEGCLNEYQAFSEQGFTVERPSMEKEVEVSITDKSIGFYLTMPLQVKQGVAKSEMKQFYVSIPLELKKYYQMANDITQMQEERNFLEMHGLELIQLYSGVSEDKLPPTSKLRFDLVPTLFWTVPNVEENFKDMLVSKIQVLRLLNSDNFYRYQYPSSDYSYFYQANYDNMVLPIEGGDGLEVSFDYYGWPIYFDVNSDGNTIKPQSMSMHYSLFHFGMQHYYTVYSISYPVLITIRDANAFNGEGYNFVFALETNIRNNFVADSDVTIPPKISPSSSMLCDEEKFETGLLKTIIVDSDDRDPLATVQIGFSIPEQDTCIMGLTDSRGQLESKYPAVYGGLFSFIKEGYLVTYAPFNSQEYKDRDAIVGYPVFGFNDYVIELHRKHKVNATIKKKVVEKCVDSTCFNSDIFSGGEEVIAKIPDDVDERHSWRYTRATQPLLDSERAVINLERISDERDGIENEEFSTSIVLFGDMMQEVELVPGVYAVSGVITLTDDMIIPEEERCTSGLLSKCYTLTEVKMDAFVPGQIDWTEEEHYITVRPDDLYGSNMIELYIPSADMLSVPPQSRIIEDLEMTGEMGEISKIPKLRNSLRPKFR